MRAARRCDLTLHAPRPESTSPTYLHLGLDRPAQGVVVPHPALATWLACAADRVRRGTGPRGVQLPRPRRSTPPLSEAWGWPSSPRRHAGVSRPRGADARAGPDVRVARDGAPPAHSLPSSRRGRLPGGSARPCIFGGEAALPALVARIGPRACGCSTPTGRPRRRSCATLHRVATSGRAAGRADRPAARQHRRLRPRPATRAGAGRGSRGAVRRRRRGGPRLPRPARADRRAVRARPVGADPGRPPLPYRRPGAVPPDGADRVPRADGLPGEDPRLPDRAGRDRSGAPARPGWPRRRCWRDDGPGEHRLVAYVGRGRRRLSAADELRERCLAAPELHGPAAFVVLAGPAAHPQRQGRPPGPRRHPTRAGGATATPRWPPPRTPLEELLAGLVPRCCGRRCGGADGQLLRSRRPLPARPPSSSPGCARRFGVDAAAAGLLRAPDARRDSAAADRAPR